MKDLYEKYFYVPKHGKVKERVMLARIAVSVVIMLVLMAGMSLSAYAYFTANNTTMIKPIKAAHYQLDTVVIAPEGLTPNSDGIYKLTNTEQNSVKSYQFRLVTDNYTSASVGFCEVVVSISGVEGTQSYFTGSIWKPVDGNSSLVTSRTIEIQVPYNCEAHVRFVSQWGTCAVETVETVNGVELIQPNFPAVIPSSDGGVSTDNANGQFEFSSASSATDSEVVTQDANTPVDQGTGNAGNE